MICYLITDWDINQNPKHKAIAVTSAKIS